MKTILLFLSVFLSANLFCQISITDLIKIAKMDRESFEIYVSERGYLYNRIEITEDKNSLFYCKDGNNYIRHSTEFLGQKFDACLQTSNVRLLSFWYKELKDLGFKSVGAHSVSGKYTKYYNRGKEGEGIFICIEKDWLEIVYSQSYGFGERN